MARRDFATASVELINDPRPTGLDLRVYLVVSLHDGMSLKKRTGAGCFAANVKLAAMVGCDYTSLSRSLSRLVTWGYLVKERHAEDKRCTTYRCVFEFDDSWQSRKPIAQPIVGETANDHGDIVGQDRTQIGEIVGRDFSEARGNLPKTDQHYIPLKGELDSVETEELDSPKVRVAVAPRFAPNGPVVFREGEPLTETLAKFERGWKKDWTQFEGYLPEWRDWLYNEAEQTAGDDNIASAWAMRLAEKVDNWISYVEWERGPSAANAGNS